MSTVAVATAPRPRQGHGVKRARAGQQKTSAPGAFVEGCKASVDKYGDKSGAAAFKQNDRSGGWWAVTGATAPGAAGEAWESPAPKSKNRINELDLGAGLGPMACGGWKAGPAALYIESYYAPRQRIMRSKMNILYLELAAGLDVLTRRRVIKQTAGEVPDVA